MSDDRGYSAGSVLLAFIAGGIVGAGVALLTAPQTGSETREKIKDLADDARDKIRSVADDAREKIQDSYERGREMVVDKKNVISNAIEAGKKAISEEKNKLMEKG